MFRKNLELMDGQNGFVNEGLEVYEGNQSTDHRKLDHGSTKIEITRSKYDQKKLHDEMLYKKPSPKSIFDSPCSSCSTESVKSCLLGAFPIFSWLHAYKKDDFIGDLISGITVAIMHIPQGMGYALLASLPPVTGIYMAFFPVLMYVVFGTSRHNSMGTFAVVSIMVGKVVNKYSNIAIQVSNSTDSQIHHNQHLPPGGYSPMEIATLVCFIVGVIQLLMYVLRLGILSFLLSECLVSGFTTGAAVHVFTSQVKDLLGLELPRIKGYFKLIKTYIEIFHAIHTVNKVAIILSLITIAILVFNNEYLKPRVAKKSKFPVPIELIAVVGGTLLSRCLGMQEAWNIIPVGHIPTGLPQPMMPNFFLWKDLVVDSLAIAFVSYSVTVSMALIFGQKLKYEINFNQELLAMGTGNILASFFSCFPFSASLSRSLIQQAVGGKTQLASIISCTLLLFVLLWIGPFFEVLPRCILASVVVVALKGMLMQVTEFPRFQQKSKADGFVWMATFLAVVVVSIDIGLLVGIFLSILCIFCNSLRAHICILGNIPHTDLFLDIERFEKAVEVPFVKIIHYSGSINFATKASFRNRISEKLRVNLLRELENSENRIVSSKGKVFVSNLNFNLLILDFSALSSIDPSSINMLTALIVDFNKLNVNVNIAGCSSRIYEILIDNEFLYLRNLYPTIQDAIATSF